MEGRCLVATDGLYDEHLHIDPLHCAPSIRSKSQRKEVRKRNKKFKKEADKERNK
jgi:hypothetical protein